MSTHYEPIDDEDRAVVTHLKAIGQEAKQRQWRLSVADVEAAACRKPIFRIGRPRAWTPRRRWLSVAWLAVVLVLVAALVVSVHVLPGNQVKPTGESQMKLTGGSAMYGNDLYDVDFLSSTNGFGIYGAPGISEALRFVKSLSLVKTDNAGQTWSTVAVLPLAPDPDRHGIDTGIPLGSGAYLEFANAELGYFGDIHGVYKTTDGGLRWSRVLSGYVLGIALKSGATWVAEKQCSGTCPYNRTHEWVAESINDGISWKVHQLPQFLGLALNTADEADLMGSQGVGAFGSLGTPPTVFATSDGWQSFTETQPCEGAYDPTKARLGPFGVIAVSSEGNTIWAVCESTFQQLSDLLAPQKYVIVVSRSRDAGKTWNVESTAGFKTSIGLPPNAILISLVATSESTAIALTSEGLQRTTDGGLIWRYVGGASQAGPTYTEEGATEPMMGVLSFVGSNGWASFVGEGLWRTTDGGSTWTLIPGSGASH